MKAFNTTVLVLATALAAGSAFAQLKLPPSLSKSAPARPAARPAPDAASASAPATAETPEAKEMAAAATLAASGWLSLLDRRDWGRAWETSAAMFRNAVPLASWMDGIPKARDLGDFIEREPDEALYRKKLAGHPDGDYVTIRYNSKFTGKADAVEIVTTVLEPDGKWRVTGYEAR
jgi:hypothetical protein